MTPRRLSLTLAAVIALMGLLVVAGAGRSGATFGSGSTNTGNRIAAAADWTGPTVSVTNPGSPLRGTVTVAATAADSISGVASVTIQRGQNGTWTDLCTDTTVSYSCAWNTTGVNDGNHDLRAIATDIAGNRTTSAIVANRAVDNLGPTVSMDDAGDAIRGTVTLSATAADAGGVTSVKIQRVLSGGTAWVDVCTDTSAPYTCPLDTTKLNNDFYDFRAVAVDVTGNTTISELITEVMVDNAAPTVAMVNPGTPLTGTVTLTATAADAETSITSVAIQRSAAGSGNWQTVCTDTSEPYSCRWDTTAVAGSFDLRAIATDVAGNTQTSTIVTNRLIDNTQPSVSAEDPGDYLRGTVTLTAGAYAGAAGNGVKNVTIQWAPAGTSTWTTVCADTAAPFACAWDTTTAATPDGLYDLRAIMTPNTGVPLTSTIVSGRRIDNSLVSGYDVQTTGIAGGHVAKIETGDAISLTWTRQMSAATLLSGWTGTGAATVYARARDGALAGLTSKNDVVDFWLNANGTGATGLGTLYLGNDFMSGGKTATFAASAALSATTVNGFAASTVRITLGALASGGGTRTPAGATAITWNPSATATDTTGAKTSTAPAIERGTTDRDF